MLGVRKLQNNLGSWGDQPVQHLIKSILNSAQDRSCWDQTLDLFVEQTGVTSACMFGIHQFSDLRMDFFYSKYIRDCAPDYLFEMLESGNDTDDIPAYQNLLAHAPYTFRSEFEMFGTDDENNFPQNEIRHESRLIGMNYRSGAALNASGPWLDGLFTQSGTRIQIDALSEWKHASQVLPLISQSLTLGRVFNEMRQKYVASLAALDHLGIGVFLTDARGFVVERNNAASEIIDLDDGLTVSKIGKLQPSNKSAEAALTHMTQERTALFAGEGAPKRSMLAIPRPSLKYDFLVSVRSLFDRAGELESNMACMFVTVIDPERKGVLSEEGIAALGQLTTAETEVASALVQGLKVPEISERRNVAENTVRMQIKALLQKLRCRSQSDIIRVAAATKLPFVD